MAIVKIALVYPDDFSIWHFHRDLLEELKRRGHAVFVITEKGEYVSLIETLGVRHISVGFNRFISPIADIKLLLWLYRIYRCHRFDVVHNFTIKANIYSSIAANLAGVPTVVGTAEGLGVLFADDPGWKLRLVRPLAHLMYRLGCAACDRFWFVNPDDMELFIKRRVLPARKAFSTISAGVNTEFYAPEQVSQADIGALRNELNFGEADTVAMMVVARAVWSKGIKEFVDTAASYRTRNPEVKFLLVGPLEEDSPDAVPADYLNDATCFDNFLWLGFRRDIRSLYAVADFVVLPSFYREGVPNVLLEAMAMAKPVITTNNVGCREVVDEGVNGYLVPTRSSDSLIDAIERLIVPPGRLKKFAQESRRKAVRDFEKRAIVNYVVDNLYRPTATPRL